MANGPAPHHTDDPATIGQQRHESDDAGTVGPSMPAIPEPMSRGMWRGGVVGALIGAVVMLPLGLIDFGGIELAWRLLVVALIGAAGGSAVGAVFFGGAVSETENPESGGDDSVVPDQMHQRRDH